MLCRRAPGHIPTSSKTETLPGSSSTRFPSRRYRQISSPVRLLRAYGLPRRTGKAHAALVGRARRGILTRRAPRGSLRAVILADALLDLSEPGLADGSVGSIQGG